ncbi:MAG TPA: aminopeptidase P family protein, partial [Verrucomicrobiae bacterium]|nr:aminopeptidase P family protein [Verrucomicrobiae bacterium]
MKNLLMATDSERDANMLYAVGMFVPDPFVYLRINGRSHVVMNDLEIDRARREAPHCRVISLSNCRQKLQRQGVKANGLAGIIRLVLREKRAGKVFVPDNFPLRLASELRDLGVKLKTKPGGFFPKREQKSAAEVKKISAALMMAEVGLAEGIQALKSAKIGKSRQLIYRNAPL